MYTLSVVSVAAGGRRQQRQVAADVDGGAVVVAHEDRAVGQGRHGAVAEVGLAEPDDRGGLRQGPLVGGGVEDLRRN